MKGDGRVKVYIAVPEDDSLRLLIEITEEMDFGELYAAYERREAAGEATAKQLFQLVVFGFMNGHYSLRSISAACGYDTGLMHIRFRATVPCRIDTNEAAVVWLNAGRAGPSLTHPDDRANDRQGR